MLNSAYSGHLWAASASVALLVGAGGFLREKRSPARWYLLLGTIALAFESVFSLLSARTGMPGPMRLWQNWRFCAGTLVPGFWLCFTLTFARENGREFLRKWAPAIVGFFSLPLLFLLSSGGDFIGLPHRHGAGNGLVLELHLGGAAQYWVQLVGALVVLMNLERTFRAAAGMVRFRIKFMLLGVGVLFAARAYTTGDVLLSGAASFQDQIIDASALLVACPLMARSLFRGETGPVLQVYPSTALLLRSVTAVLACCYLLLVGILANVLAFFTGNRIFALESVLVIVACAFLGIMLLSERARARARQFVTRHLHRPEYDYRAVWQAFVEATSRPMEQAELCDAFAKLTASTFQALTASVWLLDERKTSLGLEASTTGVKARPIFVGTPDGSAASKGLLAVREAIELEQCGETWARELMRSHPPQFKRDSTCTCAPLIVRGEVTGLIMLTDRVGAVCFTPEEKELLRAMADQAAACLLSIRLAQKQAQNKQLEAFQTMSAFFVHDLKNTAASLSLMLQNFQVHYDNPAFRKDAITGIDKTVNHINDLVARLKLLRHGLTLQPVDTDLNEVVAESLCGFYPAENREVSHELRPLPKIRLDPEKMRNVVTNLVLNAREAIGPEGRIHIETTEQNGWAVLGVCDNGCGMSQEFVKRGLFRPFQSTKKNGVGIGMFQCKMIVEAHRGRIEVETEPGKGTAFRVLLPLTTGL